MTIKNYATVIGPLFERNLYDQCFLRNRTATLTAILFMGLGAFLSFHEIVVSLERIQEMVVSLEVEKTSTTTMACTEKYHDVTKTQF